MPYANVPADKIAAMDSCVEQVMAEQGYEKERAIAICYSSVVEGLDLKSEMEKHNISAEAFTGQRVTLSDIHLESPLDKTGRSWEVVIIGPETQGDVQTIEGVQYIRSKNSRLWSISALEAATSMFEGAKVYDDHLTDAEFQQRGGMRPPGRDWLGSLVGVRWDRATQSMRAIFKTVDDAFARKLVRAQEGGILKTIGLSIDVLRDFVRKRIGESVFELVNKITRVISVDAVGDPAAGGRFVRALESLQHVPHAREANMEEMMQQIEQIMAAIEASMLPDDGKAQLKAMLEQIKAGLGAAPPAEAVTPEAMQQATEAKVAAAKYALRTIEAVVKAAGAKPAPVAVQAPPAPGLADVDRKLQEADRKLTEAKATAERILEAARVSQSQQALEAALTESGLSKPIRELIREQFEGRAVEANTIKATIEKHRAAFLADADLGHVTGHGGASPRIKVGVNEADQFVLGFVRRVWGPNGLRKFAKAFEMKWKDGAPVIGAAQEATADPSFGLSARAVEGWKSGGG